MTSSIVFSICNSLVLPQWLLMTVAPKWKWTHKLIDSKIIPLILSIVYIIYFLQGIGAEGDFGSLEGVMKLFTVDVLVLAGWVHYLAFDLLIGSWVLKKSQELGMAHWLIIPCLILCFMAGPAGFLLFCVISRFYRGGGEK